MPTVYLGMPLGNKHKDVVWDGIVEKIERRLANGGIRVKHKEDLIILSCKLRFLKHKLKEWNTANGRNLKAKKVDILYQISSLDTIQEQRLLSEDELLLKASLKMEYEEVAKNEEISWRQKSRILWLKQGDKNTKFFRRMANCHKRFNHIDTIEAHGETITDPDRIKEEIVDFYKNLYSETEHWRPLFNLQEGSIITEDDNDWLQSEFEEQEVLECLKLCAADKAPGPDGYSMGFFQCCWEIVKKDVMDTIRNFHTSDYFEKSFNATYVALITKKIGAKSLRDFIPISLIGSVYKISSKLLTERLKSD
ncbi:hypothetical protein MTR67_031253 [Solanum verrucosum]|uniref:Reverse transcriptase n=1 Tax=Solanum verrucosum TaxID=315347 RepID=A0AAF0U243_SOLVR|nr:hypothetical protein MTR67_031253 [Solanum verrucosum]